MNRIGSIFLDHDWFFLQEAFQVNIVFSRLFYTNRLRGIRMIRLCFYFIDDRFALVVANWFGYE